MTQARAFAPPSDNPLATAGTPLVALLTALEPHEPDTPAAKAFRSAILVRGQDAVSIGGADALDCLVALMTPREQAAFNAGVEAMRQMAMIAAVSIEVRDDAREVRQQAAAAALHGLAEGAMALLQPEFRDQYAHAREGEGEGEG